MDPSFPFLLKKILGVMLMPLPFALLLVVFAFLFAALGHKRKAVTMIWGALLSVFLFSWPPVSDHLMRPLEDAWPAYRNQPVKYIVVLGGWHETDPRIPVTSVLSSYSTSRLLEGIRIYDRNKRSKLYLSGYRGLNGKISNAQAMKNLALALGVPAQDILTNERPKDTHEEAIQVKQVLGDVPFALVTSASHMRRAMGLFQAQGLHPVAAPTDYLAKNNGHHSWAYWIPGSRALATSERAIHEYAGYQWAKWKKQID